MYIYVLVVVIVHLLYSINNLGWIAAYSIFILETSEKFEKI